MGQTIVWRVLLQCSWKEKKNPQGWYGGSCHAHVERDISGVGPGTSRLVAAVQRQRKRPWRGMPARASSWTRKATMRLCLSIPSPADGVCSTCCHNPHPYGYQQEEKVWTIQRDIKHLSWSKSMIPSTPWMLDHFLLCVSAATRKGKNDDTNPEFWPM
jgi:hypothetical protein